LIREISLDGSLGGPRHSIQLPGDGFVVSHEGASVHRVCIVDSSGRIIQCCGGRPSSDVGHLNRPRNLAVDKYGNVLVADEYNSRAVLLSSSLTHLGYVSVPGHRLNYTYAVHLDGVNNRFHIGEHTVSGRLFVLTV